MGLFGEVTPGFRRPSACIPAEALPGISWRCRGSPALHAPSSPALSLPLPASVAVGWRPKFFFQQKSGSPGACHCSGGVRPLGRRTPCPSFLLAHRCLRIEPTGAWVRPRQSGRGAGCGGAGPAPCYLPRRLPPPERALVLARNLRRGRAGFPRPVVGSVTPALAHHLCATPRNAGS